MEVLDVQAPELTTFGYMRFDQDKHRRDRNKRCTFCTSKYHQPLPLDVAKHNNSYRYWQTQVDFKHCISTYGLQFRSLYNLHPG